MQHQWASLVFLVTAYWPFMLGTLCIGILTGWLSLSRADAGEGRQ